MIKKFNAWIWTSLYTLASPRSFYRLSQQWQKRFAILAILLLGYGTMAGLFIAPADYQQGDAFRIIYIHVPCAFLSLMVYSFMAFCAVLHLIWRIKLADILLRASAPLGGTFAFLALLTGSLWGKPMWGTYWIWDARLTSELILLFLYLAVIALTHATENTSSGAKVVAILTLVGFLDIPLIHYSVNWWNTLHQGATLSKLARPSIDSSMLYPLLIMIAGFMCYFCWQVLARASALVLLQEYRTRWVHALLLEKSDG